MSRGWIGVDFDGTLAVYKGWGDGKPGEPVEKMVKKVKELIAEGNEIRIFTARAAHFHEEGGKEHKKLIEDWCKEHIGRVLPITNKKDFQMIQLYDDRVVQIIPNTGETVADYYYALGYFVGKNERENKE